MIERADFRQWHAKDVARLLALLEGELGYYREIAAALPVPLAVISKDRSVVWTNRAFRTKFGSRTEDLPAHGFTEIPMRALHDEDQTETLIVVGSTAPSIGAVPANIPSEIPAIVWQADTATLQFRSVQGGAEAMLGYPSSQWLGRREFFEERIHPEDRAATMALYRAVLSAGGEASAEYRATSAAGQTVWCRETIRVSGASVTGVITNITSRKQLERQLLSAGRFEALYSFAGRLAHDLNNPLMIVTGYAEELMQGLKAGDPLREEAGQILDAARRIGGLAGQLTEFARSQGKPASQVNIGDAILNLRSAITVAAGERVAVELTVNRAPILAMADPGQLGEVLAAVIAGPRRSTPRERTRITIAWDVETVAERLSPTALAAGKYARISVKDDVHEADSAAGVFDPVLSKSGDPASAAAGLALARAYSVVHEWGGDIAFSSEPGQGSTFTIYLPYIEPEGEPEGASIVRPAARRDEPATILVVDDETGIRELIRKILQRERYRVLEAGSAEEALTAAQVSAAQGQAIDLLITDVMLPGINGPELARRMQQGAPRLKTLFISGYTGQERVPAGARVLAKPFTLAVLIEKVREALVE
ncbi:MAG: Blue-light-activated protein [Bryobacterales bacterium]|nr:Blue-light-activated protein [Bryobacterales bacterium]